MHTLFVSSMIVCVCVCVCFFIVKVILATPWHYDCYLLRSLLVTLVSVTVVVFFIAVIPTFLPLMSLPLFNRLMILLVLQYPDVSQHKCGHMYSCLHVQYNIKDH